MQKSRQNFWTPEICIIIVMVMMVGGGGMYLQTHQTVHLEWVILVNETHIPIRLTKNQ